eukprot:gene12002-13241_t
MEFAELIKTTRVDNVILRRLHVPLIEGTLCLTSHHLIFSSRASEKDEMMLLYMEIEEVKKKFTGHIGVLTILCKDFSSFKLRIPGTENAANIAASIEALSTLENPTWYYPFFHRLDFKIISEGWKLYQMQTELEKLIEGSNDWRISSLNSEFKVSKTYPELVIVSKNVTDDLILKSATFRQDGRVPLLAYLNKRKVPLLRSSQPLCGPQGKRCKEDERILNLIQQLHVKKGFIYDTRSSSTISTHKSKGGGAESESKYAQWKKVILGIDRYSTLPDSIAKLYEACADTRSGAWLSKLESSGWLSMVESVLNAAVAIAEQLDVHEVPVLVHGDGGVDMTLVITSLVQVLLHPAHRTIRGLQSLVQREWLWAGHPFSRRNMKLGVSLSRYKGQGSVFLLFCDALHQIISQYPSSFEYNENLLCMLCKHSYASQFGTFFFNNELERTVEKVSVKTISLWSYLNRPEILDDITNPLYEFNEETLSPSVAPQSLSVWSSMFLKWTLPVGANSKASIFGEMKDVKKKSNELKKKAFELQREYNELCSQLEKANIAD